MKINSTIICYALIVLIVGYLIYINRNVIMGMTSKFGESIPGTKKVIIYNDCNSKLVVSDTSRHWDSSIVSRNINIPRKVGTYVLNTDEIRFNFWDYMIPEIKFDMKYFNEGDVIFVTDTNKIPLFLIYRNGKFGGYLNKRFVDNQWFSFI